MTIKVGDTIPSATFMQMKEGGPKPVSTDELFKGKKVALFALPGAFTPTCSAKHVPGFLRQAGALKAKHEADVVAEQRMLEDVAVGGSGHARCV